MNQLNKTEIIDLNRPKPKTHKLDDYLQSFSISSTEFATNLGVTIDVDLKFHRHINSVEKSSFFHFRNIFK